jgi:hypothetical protein
LAIEKKIKDVGINCSVTITVVSKANQDKPIAIDKNFTRSFRNSNVNGNKYCSNNRERFFPSF